MEVGNEMKIFITLTKYNTCQWHGKGNPLQVVKYLVSILRYLLHVQSNG